MGFESPRIVLINLDGKENAHNLRNIKALTERDDTFMYVSLYNEPSWLQKRSTILENRLETEEEVEVTFEHLCDIYSEEIINEFIRE